MTKPAFQCLRCSQCCHGEGGISLDPGEIPAAAKLLDLPPEQFVERYCQLRDGRYHIRTNDEGDCALLGPQGCLIHKAKPRICRRWPFFRALMSDRAAFEEAKLYCPGLNPEATLEEFVALARAQAEEEPEKP